MTNTSYDTAALQAGWYTDPEQSRLMRYHDGTSWTRRTIPATRGRSRTGRAVIVLAMALTLALLVIAPMALGPAGS